MQHGVMSYSEVLRGQLERKGFLIEEFLEEKRFKVRATKGTEVFSGEADTRALAFLDMNLSMKEGPDKSNRWRITSVRKRKRE